MKQQSFIKCSDEFNKFWKESGRKVHGGEYAKGKRKSARPFSKRKPIHVVMRSDRAKGALSLRSPKHHVKVKEIIEVTARSQGVSLYRYSINGNHLHLLVRAKEKSALQDFLRIIAGWIARVVLKAKKGCPMGRFWEGLTFTRLADWGQAYDHLKGYVLQNILEASGRVEYRVRKSGARGAEEQQKERRASSTSASVGLLTL